MAQQHINPDMPNSGLGDALRNAFLKVISNFNELYSSKVDKVVGKGLSDTNYTQEEKDKLAELSTGGQVQSDWNQGDNLEVGYIKNKPTNVSDFTNDSGFISDVGTVGYFARTAGGWEAIPDPTLFENTKIYERGEVQVFKKKLKTDPSYLSGQQQGDYCIGFVLNDNDELEFINGDYLGGDVTLKSSYDI